MIQEEGIEKECIKNDHKGCQIVAVELSEELNKENHQKKYYCVKCLIDKIGVKKIVPYDDEAKNKAKSEELKKNAVQLLERNQKLILAVKSIEQIGLTQFEELKKQLEIQINNQQKKLISIIEITTTNSDLELVSAFYQEDGGLARHSPIIDYTKITDSIIQIQTLLSQLENFEKLQEADQEKMKFEQQCYNDLLIDEKIKRTPALNLMCENHKMEIIMFNLNQTDLEKTNPLLCVECTQDLITRGNNAVFNVISLKKAEEKWNEYIKDQCEKRLQRQSRLNQAIGLIKKLQEKYNQELNKMIQSSNDQLKKEPKEYEQIMKLKDTRLQNQKKQSLYEIIKILGQTDQQKKQEQISNQEDSKFYNSQKKKTYLLKIKFSGCKTLIHVQYYNYLEPKRSNDSENEQELVEFLKKSTIQDLYLSFFEMSFNSLSSFKKEEQELQQKGKLTKLQQQDLENQNEALLNQQKWYKLFQENQTKLESFKKIDELQRTQLQLDELLLQDNQKKQELKKYQELVENYNDQLLSAKAKFKDFDWLSDKIGELEQLYKIGKHSFVKGDTSLLTKDYASQLYQYLEKRTNQKIKNKYLLYSSKNQGLYTDIFNKSIDKMSNLLFVFKSYSEYIFGAFSPCQCLIQSGAYQIDEQAQSFLFSQTNNEFYPISDKSKAIYCTKDLLVFGQSDLFINSGFQSGSSRLGVSYQCNQYNIPNVKNRLFGQPEPNIKICEVIMLTFV
ncbi:unnamed protein product (macronuclear) [Paramecium tetraurelia]|uniref:TLDc domain-containing protein n=1 Tax=Paramecium tetraurelia TaxID=5888 RepID=A0BKC4_PARTE|nr:uncharacterized protein GSPATT00029622001 [Paramecium tetraurelia]CAK58991.1 unnamed protein product [Paramecium tetraurelia]|eukprot:XP_001426389.1 hypothetical protein (macronuclear) [Paramecium tetraurelia strain d4-2]